jgi:hypothetical protein
MTHAIHDFAAKLRTPAVAPTLERYVEWRRELQAARAEGREEPEAPEMAPVSINLDLTLACNYACTHCIDWEILNSGPRMEEENLRESLRLMAERGLKSVILIGGGEPTLYPGFSDFVRFAKQDLGLQIAVVSNGSRGDRLLEIAPHLEEGDWIRLSLDSGSNELFREMHQPNSAAVDLDEICSWIPKIRAANPAPRLGYSFVIVWQGASRDEEQLLENIHEIVPAAIRAQEAGFDYISYKPVLERLDDGAEVMNPSHTSDDTLAVVRRADPRGARRCAGLFRDLRVHQSALPRRGHLAGIHAPTQDLPYASPAAGADAHGRVQLPRTPGRGQGPARPHRRVCRGGQGEGDRTRTRTHPRWVRCLRRVQGGDLPLPRRELVD